MALALLLEAEGDLFSYAFLLTVVGYVRAL